MLFNSLEFLIFFPLVTLIYFLIPHRFRWAHLLFASCIFYMAFIPVYVLILFFTILVDYAAGILIENAQGKKRPWYLCLSLIANIGVLAVFKYYNFFIANMNDLLTVLNISDKMGYLQIILPIGLSFHTFQAMSYTFEVYYGRQKAERHLGIYALYVMYYPQLVAGPIERPQNILPQLRTPQPFIASRVTDGLTLMMWGMIKKVVIADKLAFFADRLFSKPELYEGPAVVIGVIFFAFQIYCDFSGYSDIARGASRVMGIELMENFRRPYLSRSIHEFWKRWHISLSTWFRDYVYIPLGGNRKGIYRWLLNLLIVFLTSGFWHGASWNFIIWGALHGIFTILYAYFFLRKESRLAKLSILYWAGWIITFTVVSFAWIFFRATSFDDALLITKNLFSGWAILFQGKDASSALYLNYTFSSWLLSILLIAALLVIERMEEKKSIIAYIHSSKRWTRYAIYYIALLTLYLFGVYQQSSFIYFQF